MRVPKRSTSIVYPILFGLLIAGVAVGIALFANGLGRPSVQADIIVIGPEAVECPIGEHAPACFRFEVLNLGPEAARVDCRVIPSSGSIAEFVAGGETHTFSPELPRGQSFSLVAKAVPADADRTVREPAVRCVPS